MEDAWVGLQNAHASEATAAPHTHASEVQNLDRAPTPTSKQGKQKRLRNCTLKSTMQECPLTNARVKTAVTLSFLMTLQDCLATRVTGRATETTGVGCTTLLTSVPRTRHDRMGGRFKWQGQRAGQVGPTRRDDNNISGSNPNFLSFTLRIPP